MKTKIEIFINKRNNITENQQFKNILTKYFKVRKNKTQLGKVGFMTLSFYMVIFGNYFLL